MNQGKKRRAKIFFGGKKVHGKKEKTKVSWGVGHVPQSIILSEMHFNTVLT